MRVLIGGLLQSQCRLIEQDCPEGIELRFATADKNTPAWVAAASGCDVCIVLPDFIDHAHVIALRKAGHKPRYHKGGLSGVRAKLKALSAKTPA